MPSLRPALTVLTVAALLAVGSAHYTVRSGDTLTGIAGAHGMTARAVAAANGIANPDRIYPGQVLDVHHGSGGSSAAAPATVSRSEAERLVEETARRYGWNPAFVKAVAYMESGFNNRVVSSAGAIGIMQVLPSTGEWVSTYLVGRPLDLHDPADNVEAGVAFLDYLYDLTGGDARMTLAGYYQGLASVRANGLYPSTERYIANVLALRERF